MPVLPEFEDPMARPRYTGLATFMRAPYREDWAGVEIGLRYVGHHATSMEMAGCSITLLDLDREIESLLAAPTRCPFWPK